MSKKEKPCPCEVDSTSRACTNLNKMCNQAGVTGSAAGTYLSTSIWSHSLSRLPWLIFLLFAALGAGMLVTVYEKTFLELPLLVAFIPMIMAIAGAGGSQVSTVVIRSMVVGEITTREYLRAFAKEFWISLVCGVVLGLVIFGYIMAVYQDWMLGLVLGLGLIATIIFAKLLGMALPIIAKRIKIDPAMIAAPLVTIIADIFGIFAFFTFAQILLNI